MTDLPCDCPGAGHDPTTCTATADLTLDASIELLKRVAAASSEPQATEALCVVVDALSNALIRELNTALEHDITLPETLANRLIELCSMLPLLNSVERRGA